MGDIWWASVEVWLTRVIETTNRRDGAVDGGWGVSVKLWFGPDVLCELGHIPSPLGPPSAPCQVRTQVCQSGWLLQLSMLRSYDGRDSSPSPIYPVPTMYPALCGVVFTYSFTHQLRAVIFITVFLWARRDLTAWEAQHGRAHSFPSFSELLLINSGLTTTFPGWKGLFYFPCCLSRKWISEKLVYLNWQCF